MSKRLLIASTLAIGLGAAGTVFAQTTPTTTSPPERMTGSSTMNNPATATTPVPGSPAAMGTPGTTSATTPALGAPGPNAPSGAPANAAHSDATTPGAPVPGANSFTEGEARSRMQDHGFAQVADLKLDNQGIWRAKATKDGKDVAVALDFKGNVIAQ